MNEVSIYILVDPRTNQPCYVGQTLYPEHRIQGHICEFGNKNKRAWIDELLLLGLYPIMKIIDTVDSEQANIKEIYWIKELRKTHTLLNQLHNQNNDMVKFHTALEKSTWRRLALLAVEKEVSIFSLIRQAIQELIEREYVHHNQIP